MYTYIHVGSLKVLWDNACIKHGGWMGQYCFVQIFLGGDITTDITNVMIHPELGWFRFMKFILTSTNPLSIYIYTIYIYTYEVSSKVVVCRNNHRQFCESPVVLQGFGNLRLWYRFLSIVLHGFVQLSNV